MNLSSVFVSFGGISRLLPSCRNRKKCPNAYLPTSSWVVLHGTCENQTPDIHVTYNAKTKDIIHSFIAGSQVHVTAMNYQFQFLATLQTTARVRFDLCSMNLRTLGDTLIGRMHARTHARTSRARSTRTTYRRQAQKSLSK